MDIQESAFDALMTAINDVTENVVSVEQVVEILNVLMTQGYLLVPKEFLNSPVIITRGMHEAGLDNMTVVHIPTPGDKPKAYTYERGKERNAVNGALSAEQIQRSLEDAGPNLADWLVPDYKVPAPPKALTPLEKQVRLMELEEWTTNPPYPHTEKMLTVPDLLKTVQSALDQKPKMRDFIATHLAMRQALKKETVGNYGLAPPHELSAASLLRKIHRRIPHDLQSLRKPLPKEEESWQDRFQNIVRETNDRWIVDNLKATPGWDELTGRARQYLVDYFITHRNMRALDFKRVATTFSKREGVLSETDGIYSAGILLKLEIPDGPEGA